MTRAGSRMLDGQPLEPGHHHRPCVNEAADKYNATRKPWQRSDRFRVLVARGDGHPHTDPQDIWMPYSCNRICEMAASRCTRLTSATTHHPTRLRQLAPVEPRRPARLATRFDGKLLLGATRFSLSVLHGDNDVADMRRPTLTQRWIRRAQDASQLPRSL